MKKDNYRDYVVDAMRYYSLCGCPDSNALRQMKSVLPPDGSAAYSDLLAVERMLYRLANEEYGPDAVMCVKYVYFARPGYTAARNEITARVREASDRLMMTEAYVYRALRRARTLVALERGLRVREEHLIIPR